MYLGGGTDPSWKMTHVKGGVKIGQLRAPDLPAVNVLNFIRKGATAMLPLTVANLLVYSCRCVIFNR